MVRIGDKFKIDVPRPGSWVVKEFEVIDIYNNYAVLTDGIIRVCYQLCELESYEQPISGYWN